jgi:ribosomal protein S27AE
MMSLMKTIRITKAQCPKCQAVWIPRVTTPRRCPRCGNRL